MYIKNLKKEVGITIKSKQTSNQPEPITRNLSCISYCYNSKPNACINIAFPNTSTGFNYYFGWSILHTFILYVPAKVGIKSCRCARECFIYTCIWLWVITVANTRYISCDWVELVTCLHTFYCDPYFLFQILFSYTSCLFTFYRI